MSKRFTKLVLALALLLTIALPAQALANNPTATVAGLAIDAVIVGLQAAIAADQAVAGGKVGSAAARVSEETGKRVIDPTFVKVIREVGLNLLDFVGKRLAYDAAVALSSAGSGQTPLVYFESPKAYWEQLGMDIVGETIGSLNEALESEDLKFGLCTPQDPLARLSIQIGLASAYGASGVRPKCEFQDFLNNINAIGARYAGEEFGTQNILRQFANAWQPGQNELSASIGLNLKVHEEVQLEKTLNFQKYIADQGFKSVVDAITGQTETPSTLVWLEAQALTELEEFQTTRSTKAQLDNYYRVLHLADREVLKDMGIQALSVFANTLLSSLGNRIFSGIFNPPNIVGFDPFNPQASTPGGRERAEEAFRAILSPAIISFDDYDIMNEFVICTGDDLRGLNNCVMDQAFAVAVGQGNTSQPLTVKEAIEAGYLHGDWPLIPSKDEGRNQDIRCSSYGYCYANLVKMRKARVIPVGWELAADSPWNEESSPVTLQDAVDGFFNCNDEGQADATHPWCHLIDPNWILKIPPAQCRAFVPSELPVSGLINARQSVCVDSPTCIDQDADGNCVGGYGYCTEERNTWQFRGDSCPADYAGCLAFNNVRTGGSGTYLLNTVNTQGCSAENAGCRWYRTNKYEDDQDTPELTDDTFEFLPTGESYVVANHDDDVDAFEDRLYMNQNAGVCSAEVAGCTELISADASRLNLLRNPSFENDKDEDGIPDGWSLNYPSVYDTISGEAFQGTSVLTSQTNAIVATQSEIPLSPNRFYTLSAYVKNEVSISGSFLVQLFSEDSAELVTTTLGDCTASGNTVEIAIIPLSIEDEYERKTCTFTTPSFATRATVFALFGTGGIFVDALQLELGSVAGTFQEGYGSGLITREYLTVPPAWMGCTGATSDPAECSAYTRVCSAQDVGCDLYTPATGGFGVPAVTSAADTCPNECVGYETYKQEATPYEAEAFPLYFIADSAQVCSQADVGCDAYTNLNEVALGGEGIEYYSGLRFCAQPSQNTGSTFYTWEGTEAEGFQLRAWQLLESNLNDARDTNYVEGTTTVFSEVGVGLAPCTHSVVTSETTVACQDVVRNTTETDTYTDCNEHADAISNPDCREFYDSAGNIHYRQLSQTAVISDSCAPYRKDSGTQLDCTTSGGFWTGGGSCRYFVLGSESNACSEAAAGCRAYTGASGRNASTIFADTVEDDTLNEYTSASPATISNESVAAGGHSIRVTGGALSMISLVEGTAVIASGDTNADGQCDAGELCTLREGSSGSTCQVVGTDADGVDDCGPLVGRLVQGKTYIVEFWAKGVGTVTPRFVADRGVSGATTWDIGDAAATPPANSVALTGGWQLYSVGPLDTSDATLFADFDDTAILRFFATGSSDYFIDNIVLKETEENLALIKDSWVTPSTCDLSPTGTPSPQHYLGCQAYTDRAGTEQNLYQFTRLCSEEVIGCSAYFDTQNSESAFGAVFNATCSRPSGSPIPVGAEACTMGDETVCTIAAGRSSCHFDFDGALPSPLPSFADGDDFDIVLGPEARVVSGDSDVFLVNKGNTSCGAASAGCTEVGLPDFSQDKAAVTGFETTYLLDDPDRYDATLCDTEGLFCEAWSTKADGTFYFKDPDNQTCDFKPSVTINNQNYSGWFRAGTNDPCYYDDLDADGVFDVATELSTAYTISGIEFGIWRNGDADDYDGWLATCPSRYDRCAEFVDPMDTTGGLYPNGTPYVYLKNDKIEESSLSGGERCNGEVNLNEGCALFFDSIQPELMWNASASYIVSEHADTLKGEAAQSSQSPISCAGAAAAPLVERNDIGRVLSPSGVEFNVCQSRCRYLPEEDGVIEHPYADRRTVNPTYTYTTSCIQDNDCPTLKDSNNKSVTGECRQAYEHNPDGLQPAYDTHLVQYVINFDDVNDVRKVARDRQCSEWLTCSSTIQVWDDRIGRYREICDQIGACTQYSKVGDVNICSGFAQAPALPLSQDRYVNRDVSWWGEDFSGYAIPNNIPTQLLDQVNINPNFACSLQPNIECSMATSEADCEDLGLGVCQAFDEDIRLAYNAGTCPSSALARDSACYVGTCADSGFACSNNNECDTAAGEECEIGFCENTEIGVFCSEDADCDQGDLNDPNDNFSCQSGLCKQQTSTTCSPNDSPSSCASSASVSGQCILEETSFRGGCFANNCLLAADGAPFTPGFTNAVECKAYPEQNSPYPHRVAGGSDPFGVLETTGIVTQWVDPIESSDPDNVEPDSDLTAIFNLAFLLDMDVPDDIRDWITYTKRPGFQGIQTCAPNGGDCSCTYQKVTYGNGIKTKYYNRDLDSDEFLTGVCLGGESEGMECQTDANCNNNDAELAIGRCVKPTSVETMLGVDGYCLERDTAINKWKHPNKTFGGECLTWLPVDQLTGSNDIYNQSIGAGALLDQDVLYCTETALFADLYVTGSTYPGGDNNQITNGCAETTRFINGSGDSCDSSDFDNCGANAHCPKGYFAVVGKCDQDLDAYDNAYDCQTGGDDDVDTTGSDDDCPYFCVPQDAQNYTDNGAVCSPPSLTSSGNPNPTDYTDNTGPDIYIPWQTPYYYVSNFADRLNQYRTCARFGATIPNDYQRLLQLAVGNPQSGYFQMNSDEPYLACEETVQVSDADDGNKAWTNRLWSDASFSLQDTASLNDLEYQVTTEPIAPYGRVDMGVLERVGNNWQRVGDEAAPVAVESCIESSDNYTVATVSACANPAPVEGEARSYEMLSAIVTENLSSLASCSNPGGNASCNSGVNCRTAPVNHGCFKRCDPNLNNSNGTNGSLGYINGEDEPSAVVGCYYDPDQNGNAWSNLGSCVTLGSTNSVMDLNDDSNEYVCEIPASVDDCGADDDLSGVPAATGPNVPSGYAGRTSRGFCEGGTWGDVADDAVHVAQPKAWCNANIACYSQLCSGTTGNKHCVPFGFNATQLAEITSSESSDDDDSVIATEVIRQIFAKVFDFFQYTSGGVYALVTDNSYDAASPGDISEDPDDYLYPSLDPPSAGTAPIVRGLDDCFSSGCREAGNDTVTVNGVTGGTILGDEGAAHVSVQFFAEANANQLPIRNVIVNFGDGHQSGSTGPANYYKNRRGLDQNADDIPFCNKNTKWGETSASCEPNYFTFTHDYVCTEARVATLPECGSSGDLSDGCSEDGSCQFVPRVHVKDNWGYCTGECGGNNSPADGVCYDNTGNPPLNPGDPQAYDECNLECDGETNSGCPAQAFLGSINPWIYYDGAVRVEP